MNFIKQLQVKPGQNIRLSKHNPSFTGPFEKEKAAARIEKNIERLKEQQNLLYAEGKRSLLIILQGLDTAGKDGAIRQVFSGVNPQGCQVVSFKAPSLDESAHDFLWRIHSRVPAKGGITIFNRSQYEDVLVPRVKNLVDKDVWKKRYDQINDFERLLHENGTQILKFFLHISKEEQKERLEARLQDKNKTWKFNPGDLKDRAYWKDFMKAYEELLSRCSTTCAPWFIIPANKKWFRNLAISEILDQTLKKMNFKVPEPSFNPRKIKIR